MLDRSFRGPLDDEARAGFLEWAAAVSQQATCDVLASQRGLDLTGELAGVTQPAIVVHGRYDRARPPGQGRELASSLPDAVFRLVETGHSPVYEAPCRRSRRRPRCPGANPLNGADDPGQGTL